MTGPDRTWSHGQEGALHMGGPGAQRGQAGATPGCSGSLPGAWMTPAVERSSVGCPAGGGHGPPLSAPCWPGPARRGSGQRRPPRPRPPAPRHRARFAPVPLSCPSASLPAPGAAGPWKGNPHILCVSHSTWLGVFLDHPEDND